MAKMTKKNLGCIIAVAFVLFLIGGIVFSHQKGFYYPVFRKDVYDKNHYALTKDGKCDISWVNASVQKRRYVESLENDEVQYANTSYRRIANVTVMNGGKQIGIGFYGFTIVIEPKDDTGNYVTWFHQTGSKMEYDPQDSSQLKKRIQN